VRQTLRPLPVICKASLNETIDPVTTPRDPESTARDTKDLARGALVGFVGKLGRASRGAFIWVISWLCGLDVQGLYTVAWGIVSTVNKVGRFGMQRAVVRFVVAARADGDEGALERAQAAAMAAALFVSVVAGAITYLSADHIADFYNRPIAPALRIMAMSAPFMAATAVLLASTRALRIMRYDVYVNSIAGPLLLLLGGLVVGYYGGGLAGIAWAQVVMAVGICILAAHYFKRFFSVSGFLRHLGRSLPWWPMTRFSFPVMLADVLYSLLTQIDVLMMLFFVDGKLVGLYAIARRVASIMLKAFQAFDPIFSPIVSELAHREQHGELSYQFGVVSRWILTINLPLFAGMLILSDYFMTVAGGVDVLELTPDELSAGITVLLILSFGMMIQGIFGVGESLLAMEGRPYLNMCNNALWLTANVLINLWLLPRYGIIGGAVAATASMVVANTARLAQIYKIHRIHPFRRLLLKPLLAAGFPAVGLLLLRSVLDLESRTVMVASQVLYFGVYLGLLWLFRLEAEDRVLLGRLWRQVRQYREKPDANRK
jgi:O-antigen/teichoic acid export membrane protein